MSDPRARFLECVLSNANNRVILERAARLGLTDWWLTAGAVFQTVWNVLSGRRAQEGILDYDLFYFDADDLSSETETSVNRAASALFSDLDVAVEARNEARVHLWYEQDFGVPAAPFRSCRDAIDHFAATTCCFAVTAQGSGGFEVYAPHGYDDLFAGRVRPNPVLAPRTVYDAKTSRWEREWPSLSIQPWPTGRPAAAPSSLV